MMRPVREQLAGARGADQARQEVAGTHTGVNAEFGERHAHLRVSHGDADVAGEGEAEAGADGVTVDGGDGRDGQRLNRQKALVELARRAAHAVLAGIAETGVARQHAEVAAAAESLAGPGDDQHAQTRIAAHLLDGAAHFLAHRRRHRVARVGTVESERGDVVVAGEPNVFEVSPPGRAEPSVRTAA